MKPIVAFYTFAPIALAGLVLSVATHVMALRGQYGPLGDSSMVLHLGIFVVWLPAIFVARKSAQTAGRTKYWKDSLRGLPSWVPYALHALLLYAFINFFIGIANSPARDQGEPSVSTLRLFSGHWILFYAYGLAMLCSAANLAESVVSGGIEDGKSH